MKNTSFKVQIGGKGYAIPLAMSLPLMLMAITKQP